MKSPMNNKAMAVRILEAATGVAIGMRIQGKSAVRRVIGTADWKHDPERKAAADAKRQRRQARNLKNSSL
jgi:hypothetical protein